MVYALRLMVTGVDALWLELDGLHQSSIAPTIKLDGLGFSIGGSDIRAELEPRTRNTTLASTQGLGFGVWGSRFGSKGVLI